MLCSRLALSTTPHLYDVCVRQQQQGDDGQSHVRMRCAACYWSVATCGERSSALTSRALCECHREGPPRACSSTHPLIICCGDAARAARALLGGTRSTNAQLHNALFDGRNEIVRANNLFFLRMKTHTRARLCLMCAAKGPCCFLCCVLMHVKRLGAGALCGVGRRSSCGMCEQRVAIYRTLTRVHGGRISR